MGTREFCPQFNNKIFDVDQTLFKVLMDWVGWREGLALEMKRIDPKFVGTGRSNDRCNQFVLRQEGHVKQVAARDAISAFNTGHEITTNSGFEFNWPLIAAIKADTESTKHIFTSNNLPIVKLGLAACGLTGFFTGKIITRADVMQLKPNNEGLELIIARGNRYDFVLFGDDENDRLAAEASQIAFVKVNYPFIVKV